MPPRSSRCSPTAGVLAIDEGPYLVRFVTHLDVDDADIEEAATIAVATMERLAG